MIVPPRASHCFSSLIWLSRNKSVQKSRFSRIVKNSREFSLLDLDLEAFWFHFSLLEKEWKHFDFTLHFSKKSESIFFHFALLEKEWKLFIFTFHFSNFKNPLSLVPEPHQPHALWGSSGQGGGQLPTGERGSVEEEIFNCCQLPDNLQPDQPDDGHPIQGELPEWPDQKVTNQKG